MEWLNAPWGQATMAIASALGLWRRRSLANAVDTIADIATALYRLERCEALCRAKDLTIQDKTAENTELSETNDRLRVVITRLRAGDDSNAGFSNVAAKLSQPSKPSPMIPSSSTPSDTNAPVK